MPRCRTWHRCAVESVKTSELIVLIGVGLVATYVVTMMLRDWRRKRRIIASFAARLQHDDEQFGRAYFNDAKRADIAVRARRVLSKNLEMPLNGLTPSDRLNEDLNAEVVLNPDLFWELETEFGIITGADDVQAFEKTLERGHVPGSRGIPAHENVRATAAEARSRGRGETFAGL